MDTSHTVKSRDNVAPRTAVGRSNMVRTDLSPSQSVNAAQQASVAHHAPHTTRDPSLDPQCHVVLEREREERERRRRARKDEILLRQKAYGRSAGQPEASQSGDGTPHADFQV